VGSRAAAPGGGDRDRQGLGYLAVLHALDETQHESRAVALADALQQASDAHQLVLGLHVFESLSLASELIECCRRLVARMVASAPRVMLARANRNSDDEHADGRRVT
jgi:hypothetical protein